MMVKKLEISDEGEKHTETHQTPESLHHLHRRCLFNIPRFKDRLRPTAQNLK